MTLYTEIRHLFHFKFDFGFREGSAVLKTWARFFFLSFAPGRSHKNKYLRFLKCHKAMMLNVCDIPTVNHFYFHRPFYNFSN